MNEECPESVYKDNRHEWESGPPWRDLKIKLCTKCRTVLVLQLTDSGGQPGDVWDLVAIGHLLPE